MAELDNSDASQKWYFYTDTGEVSQGITRSWDNRMGPYDTREEAEKALERVAENNEKFDDADREWNEGQQD